MYTIFFGIKDVKTVGTATIRLALINRHDA